MSDSDADRCEVDMERKGERERESERRTGREGRVVVKTGTAAG